LQKKKEGTAETVSLLLIKNRKYHEKSKKNASKKLMKIQESNMSKSLLQAKNAGALCLSVF
jgi:hypothetical protein